MASNSSGLLSEADALLLKSYASLTIQEVLGILFEGVFFGAYSIFFALAVYSIRKGGVRSRKAIIMSAVVGYLYAASVTAWAVDCYIAFKNIHSLFMTTEIPLLDRADLADDTFNKFVGVQEMLFVFNAIVADAVVIWRTWAVYQGWIPAIVAPCVLLLAAFVFALIDVTFSLYQGSTPLPGAATIYVKSQILVWGFSLGTNILCTLLIGFKAWQHRKIMKELSLGVKYHGISTENVLSLLVESGFIYSFLWGTQIMGYLIFGPNSPWNFISEVVVRIGRQITGMYPTLIIVIVNFKRTMWEQYPITTRGHGLNSLNWAVNTGRSGGTRTDTRPEVGIHLDTVSEATRADSGIHRRDKQLAYEEFSSQDRVVVL
ncbi:hypothetical protein DFH08DRAFT_901063 [Mycena albidolilacea]|uniref:Uncharacterized protein n=1 Tax=Mycena albidolilacea TaxID=1033008 RepID=A0AAD6Z5E8_9AGAR|nr:hypothetical protein DFH08DRAFT_901063 [Mycena albidolilacea]